MTIRQQIDGLVREMVAKGILYDDASREFEARFISVALEEETVSYTHLTLPTLCSV